MPALSADLIAAGSIASAASVAVSSPGATTAGTASYTAAQASLAATLASLDIQVATAEPTLQSDDLPTAAAAAANLAQLTAARAYTARAARNLAGAST